MTMTSAAGGRRAALVRNDSGGYSLPPAAGDWFGQGFGAFVWDAQSARRIPGVARCLQLYGGMAKQMELEAWRGTDPLPQPRLLFRPDPNNARSWFVQVSIEDYLLNGNAISYVTSRGVDGWPTTVSWLPANWVTMLWESFGARPSYFFAGQPLNTDDVIHIKRGADRWYPVRGVGVIEEHLADLDRIAMETEYERSALAAGAVPSVAIIANTTGLTQEVADETKSTWMAKFAGPTREPAILPGGSQVIPLAWSPTDAQLTEARKLSLQDVANMWNVDGFWLGAPASGLTYRSAAPLYQTLLRTSIEPVLVDFEDVWSDAWLPRGQTIRFERSKLLREDLPTTAAALVALVGAGILNQEQARAVLAMPLPAGSGSEQMALQDNADDNAPDTAPAADAPGA